MARLDTKPDVDELNPAEKIYRAEIDSGNNPGIKAGIDQLEAYANDPENHKSEDKLRQLEEDSAPDQSTFYRPSNKSSRPKKFVGKALWKRKGPIGVIAGILTGGGLIAGMLSPGLAGMAFIENTLGDINDKLGALTIGNDHILRNKLVKNARPGAVTGCTTLSISCKMKTFSNSELARMERAGIKVIGEKNVLLGTRTKASGVEFQGKSYSASQWANELKTNSSARNAQLRANNMRYRGLSVNGPFGKVMNRFGVSKKAPGLSGSKEDRLNQLLTAAGTSDARNVRFAEIDDGSGRRVVVTDGMNVSEVDGRITVLESNLPPNTQIYTDAQYQEIQSKTLDRTAKAAPPSRIKSASVGAVSVLGVVDLGCSIKNMVTGASIAAKIANETSLVRYAMPLLSSINRIKAGEATPEDAETIGDFLTQTDMREQVEGVIQNSEGKPASGLVDNPNYRRSAMDSRLLSMSTNGGVAIPTETSTQYALGLSLSTLLAGAGSAALSATTAINNAGGAETCGIVQHPLTRIAGIAVAVAAGVGSAGGSIAAQAAVAVAMISSMYILEQTLNYAFSGDITQGIAEDPVGRGEALWTGMAALEGATARQSGLMPSGIDDMRQYNQITKSVNQSYIAMDQEEAKKSPLDITNQYSFLGSIARTTASNFGYSPSPLNFALGLVNTSMGIVKTANPVQASTTFNEERFKLCDDKEYVRLGIAADVQCNVRYSMPAQDLNLEPDDVVKWMSDNNFVSEDSETGLPEGYTPPDQRQVQQGLIGQVTGVVEGMTIGQFVDSRNIPDNDYARYLEACVYRTAPYGETGEEMGLVGALGDWADGSRCREQGAPYSYFRMYTLYKSIVEMNDEEENFNQAAANPQTNPSTNEPNNLPPPSTDGWSSPMPGRAITFDYRAVGRKGIHKGVDLGAPRGVNVLAARDGTVTASWDMGSCGWATVISSDGLPGIYHAYQHMDPLVKRGDKVTRGQVIGKVGRFCGSGHHLHFSIETRPDRVSAYSDSGAKDTSLNPHDYISFSDPVNPGGQTAQ